MERHERKKSTAFRESLVTERSGFLTRVGTKPERFFGWFMSGRWVLFVFQVVPLPNLVQKQMILAGEQSDR